MYRLLTSSALRIPVFIVAAVVSFAVLWLATLAWGGLSVTVWNVVRFASLSAGLSLVLTVPAPSLIRLIRGHAATAGCIAFLIAALIMTEADPSHRPGAAKFYEICATTIPILLLGLVLDARLFEEFPSSPIWVLFNMTFLAGGEGAALIAIVYDQSTVGLFAWSAGALVGAFVTLMASAVSRATTNVDAQTGESVLARLFADSSPAIEPQPDEAEAPPQAP